MATGYAVANSQMVWAAGNARIVEPDVIVLDQVEQYLPGWEDPQMVFAFAAIATREDARTFAERYGLLWHGPDDTSLRESFGDWKREANNVLAILWLYVTIRAAASGKQSALAELREDWHSTYPTQPVADDDDLLVRISVEMSDQFPPISHRVVADASYEGGQPGVLRFAPAPRDLLGLIYHDLALLIVNRQEVRFCEECRRAFDVHDQRQRYCCSTCANRARWRRHVERHRATEH